MDKNMQSQLDTIADSCREALSRAAAAEERTLQLEQRLSQLESQQRQMLEALKQTKARSDQLALDLSASIESDAESTKTVSSAVTQLSNSLSILTRQLQHFDSRMLLRLGEQDNQLTHLKSQMDRMIQSVSSSLDALEASSAAEQNAQGATRRSLEELTKQLALLNPPATASSAKSPTVPVPAPTRISLKNQPLPTRLL